ncbi:hypothetical protein [Actinoallomurus sp. NPDC052274]|uniref:hypothetical protein n=1 Tax=Actinoallomurus sp. NPDC052274 TaxID=3155420 RepID=UPI003441012B
MAVTEVQVASLRSFLAGDPGEGVQLTRRLVESGHTEGYGELVYAAFVTAVRRRFSPTWTIPKIVRFVATARANLLGNDVEVDPQAAEAVIRRALGDSVATVSEDKATARAQIFLLFELIDDEELDSAGLDTFLAEARSLANRLMS